MTGSWNKDSIAKIATIDAESLADSNCPHEKQKLLRAAQESGLFNVALNSTAQGREILKMLPEIYRISDKYFAQSRESKEKDQRVDQKPNQDRGYKSSDCDETFEFSLDELQDNTIKLPASLEKDKEIIEQFCEKCHEVCHNVLQTISDGLGYKDDELKKKHSSKSDSGLKLISEPALAKLSEVGDNTHTDGGSLTMIFTQNWGILAKEQTSDSWGFIEPVDGCALFNVADSLQRMTGGKVHSPVHRVTQREDGAEARTFLSYYLRPDYDTAQTA